jgi:hypothetical protein
MKIVTSIVTIALAVAFAGSAMAAAPKSKSACEKANMTWNAAKKQCS